MAKQHNNSHRTMVLACRQHHGNFSACACTKYDPKVHVWIFGSEAEITTFHQTGVEPDHWEILCRYVEEPARRTR